MLHYRPPHPSRPLQSTAQEQNLGTGLPPPTRRAPSLPETSPAGTPRSEPPALSPETVQARGRALTVPGPDLWKGEDQGQLGTAQWEGGREKHGPGRAARGCLPLPVPQEGFFLLQEGGAPARAHFSGISLGTVMIPV